MNIKFKKLTTTARIPKYQTSGSAGMDLHADLPHTIVLLPRTMRVIPTGLAAAIPEGHEGRIRSRSSMAKRGLTIPTGTIDSDFRGPLNVLLENTGNHDQTIAPGDRIAQLVISPVVQPEIMIVDELDETTRGTGGFGSTGIN